MPVTPLMERVRRRSARLLGDGPIVLMYHHVGSPVTDPWELAVSELHFQQHVEVLRRHRALMSLAELTRRHADGTLPADAAAITFDDGYASNLHLAKPILQKFEAPATVFVTTGFLRDPGEPWWDQLGSLLLGPTNLPSELTVRVAGQERTWRNAGWSPALRKAVHDEMHRLLVPSTEEHQRDAVAQLRKLIPTPLPCDAQRRTVTDSELCALAEGGLVEIGAHTVRHPSLPSLSAVEQYQEIASSKHELERRLGIPIRGFAYPYGDHDRESVTAVRELDFAYACTTSQGYIHRNDNRFRLPRFFVKDWDGDGFSRRFAKQTRRSLLSRSALPRAHGLAANSGSGVYRS